MRIMPSWMQFHTIVKQTISSLSLYGSCSVQYLQKDNMKLIFSVKAFKKTTSENIWTLWKVPKR